MPVTRKVPQFMLRCQINGQWLVWSCPYCSHINRDEIAIGRYKYRCHHNRCKVQFIVGFVFYDSPGGGPLRFPPDMVIGEEEEAFPQAQLWPERYRLGEPVHRLVISETVLAQVDQEDEAV